MPALEDLHARRLRIHRLEPSRPLRDARAAAAFVLERGIVMESGRSSLPVLAEAITGRHLRGSWMADREVYRIYGIMNGVRKHGIFGVPLIDGKETLLTPELCPAVERVAADPDRRERARDTLPPLARKLLDDVERDGEVRMDRWPEALGPGRRARLLLVRALLVWSRSLHTERGYHTAVVVPWQASAFSKRFARRAVRLDLEEAERALLAAALRSAVVAPEPEVRRWFVFGAGPLDRLDEGIVRRVPSGHVAWLTAEAGERERQIRGRAGRARRG